MPKSKMISLVTSILGIIDRIIIAILVYCLFIQYGQRWFSKKRRQFRRPSEDGDEFI